MTLWPVERDAGHVLSGIQAVSSGRGGEFRFTGIAPGEYYLAAWDTAETGVLWNYDFLTKFTQTAAKVRLEESSQTKQDAPRISQTAFETEFAKFP